MRSGEMKLKISICDDEEFFLEKINRLTEQYFNHKGIMTEFQKSFMRVAIVDP